MKLTLVGFIFMYEKVRIFVLNNRDLMKKHQGKREKCEYVL